MSRRREFTRDVKAAIVKRAMISSGEIACEGCGLVLGKKPYHIDHIKPDGLEIDKSRKLTPADGQLLGVECCHAPKTKQDVKTIADAKRAEAKHLGIKRPKQTIKSAGFEKKERHPKQALPPKQLYQERRP